MFCGLCTVTYLHNKNQQDALFYSQFISIINFYMFRAGLMLIIRRCFLYINQLLCVMCLCWLAASASCSFLLRCHTKFDRNSQLVVLCSLKHLSIKKKNQPCKTVYRWTATSAGNMFQDLPQIIKNAIYSVIFM